MNLMSWERQKREDHQETTVTKGRPPTAVHKGHSQSLHEVVRPTARGARAKSRRSLGLEKAEERTDRMALRRSV